MLILSPKQALDLRELVLTQKAKAKALRRAEAVEALPSEGERRKEKGERERRKKLYIKTLESA